MNQFYMVPEGISFVGRMPAIYRFRNTIMIMLNKRTFDRIDYLYIFFNIYNIVDVAMTF